MDNQTDTTKCNDIQDIPYEQMDEQTDKAKRPYIKRSVKLVNQNYWDLLKFKFHFINRFFLPQVLIQTLVHQGQTLLPASWGIRGMQGPGPSLIELGSPSLGGSDVYWVALQPQGCHPGYPCPHSTFSQFVFG